MAGHQIGLRQQAGHAVGFLALAALWIVLVRIVPAGTPQTAAVVGGGLAVAALFVYLLMRHIRAVLGGTPRLILHSVGAGLQLALFLLAFALVHHHLGIRDNTLPSPTIVHAFGESVYYSIVTYTTLGYGDFYPVGPGRALAAIQALTGYLTLGLLATTAANALNPDEKAGWDQEEA